MVNENDFFKEIEEFEYEKIPGNFEISFFYTSGDKDVFHLDYDPRIHCLISAKKRNKYYFLQDTLINLDNVEKIVFKDLDK